ncbi:hypothetical protein [Flavobacterium yafengii]|uniref:hypothetical protein n=1 Tax=Flavobacterium yafengii TaxID=3041253 RepID=UPI0024A87015|nr:hypothetical protein [Flavobacterium yafengii]MDI5888443.1 hypothetical protein [Flavobacterium yafengii]
MEVKNYVIEQNYDNYKNEDHQTWSVLYKRQEDSHNKWVCKEYLNGFDKLKFDKNKIEVIASVSERLFAISGWSLVPVSGLLPPKDFFQMLMQKKYPVTVSIREPWEIDFSEQPDIFHDVCGHIPLLTNERFVDFLTSFSAISMKYIDNEKAMDLLSRVYWFTYETGLINEDGIFKFYGGAVITSAEEMSKVNNPNTPKYPFDLDHIFNTSFNSFELQNEYFVIDSFEKLFNCLEGLEQKLECHLQNTLATL